MQLEPMQGNTKQLGRARWKPDPAIDLDDLEQFILTNPGCNYLAVERRYECATSTARKYIYMLLEQERIETRKDKSTGRRTFWPIQDEEEIQVVHIDIRRQKLAAWSPEDWGIDIREFMR